MKIVQTEEDLEEMVRLQMERVDRPTLVQEEPSDVEVILAEIRNLSGVIAEAVSKPSPVVEKVVSRDEIKPELTALLTEMKGFSAKVATVLNRPIEAVTTALVPPPIVNVASPSVTLAPNIQVERPSKWRFTVTKRDPNAQYRIQEIIAEIIE